MWVAIFVAAIASMGASFMLWFLIGLLRESAPSTCYWIVPIRCEMERESDHELSGSVKNGDHRPEYEPSDYYVELLENQIHAKHGASGLIALDVRIIPGRVGWRSIQSGHAALFHQRRG